MIVQVVRTPLDLQRTLEANLCRVNHWTDGPAPHDSAVIEQILGQTFSERGWDAPGVPLDSLLAIAEPLHRLAERGLQLVAMVSRGSYRLRAGSAFLRDISFEMADYLVAPDPCYFRPAGAAFESPIHTLGSRCAAGHATIVGESGSGERQKAFQIWTSQGSVVRDFERSVPWCADCDADTDRLVG